MIVVDSSALLAIVLKEEKAEQCASILETKQDFLISAATLAETLIVTGRRGVGPATLRLISDLDLDVVSVTHEMALQVADAYSRWGGGVHKASLNFGDCFAYALAKERDCGLLFVGNDFSQTDVKRVL